MTKDELTEAVNSRLVPEILSLDLVATDPFWRNRGFSEKFQLKLHDAIYVLTEAVKMAEEEMNNMEEENGQVKFAKRSQRILDSR